MLTKHIKQLKIVNGTWVIELWNTQIIYGNNNLAESILKIAEYTYPMPELSCTMDLTKTELLKAA
jgi:hypothetical protein